MPVLFALPSIAPALRCIALALPSIVLALLAAAHAGSVSPPKGDAGSPPKARTFRHAILISVDGLRSDALLADKPGTLKTFERLRRGAGTLNARTDPDWTLTLPNHTAMFTGRFVEGDEGHGWRRNVEPRPGENLHANHKSYVTSCFDVAHDRGLRTGIWTGKTKFSLYATSWDEERGAPDLVPPDNGRDKLDVHCFSLDPTELVDALLAELRSSAQGTFLFFHFAPTDLTGHLLGWDVAPGSPYMTAVELADAEIGRILDAIEGDPKLRGTVAVLLTTDHGGGKPFKSHDRKAEAVDYVIPFLVWTGDADTARDLYALNPDTRRDPELRQVARDDTGLPPVRNGDAGNLLLELLGLPAVPGSQIGAAQDLRIFPEAAAAK